MGFIVDFYCHKARLIVELDGPIHQQTHLYDAERTRILRAHGFLILRFTNDAVYYDFERVLFKISHVVHKRASADQTP